MVTLQAADKVLKSVYLDAVCDQLNNKTNPFYAAIKKGSEEVSGKSATCVCRYGINGGMGSATETGSLPASGGNNYLHLVAELKNIYGTIEISDKALRASRESAGALVNILNAEMEGLLEAAKFNFARMLWQNGNGVVAKVGDLTGHSSKASMPVDSVANLSEGMVIDFLSAAKTVASAGHRISRIDRTANMVYFTPSIDASVTLAAGNFITLQQSYNAELFGIPYLFDTTINSVYGTPRTLLEPILPTSAALTGGTLTTDAMQAVLDGIEARTGTGINMILCDFAVRRKYLAYLQTTRTNIDYLNLDGGFKALSYNGIPVVADKFATPGSMYFLNTDDYKLVQLADWQWLEGETGGVLTQLEKTPTYSGTLVKYANLMCTRPAGQGRLTGIN